MCVHKLLINYYCTVRNAMQSMVLLSVCPKRGGIVIT